MPSKDATALVRPSVWRAALLHSGFALMGVMTVLLGPMLPLLSARWSLNDTQAGYLFTAQFATSTVGVLLSSVVVRRHGYRLALFLGLSLMGLGAVGLTASSWAWGLLSICSIGAGIGFTSPTTNLLISEMYANSRAAALNLLNFSWGAGAVTCPFLVAAFARDQHIPFFLYGTAAVLAMVGVVLASTSMQVELPREKTQPGDRTRVWGNRLVLILGSLFFVYVGTESAVGGWVASYDRRLTPDGGNFWTIAPAFFWGALLTGRAVAPLLLRRVKEAHLAIAGLSLALLGVLVLFFAHNEQDVVIATVVSGLGLASIYPITIALLSHWFGVQATRISGVMFGLSGLGGAVMPWLVGVTSTHFGGLQAGLLVPFFGSAWMLAVYCIYVLPRDVDRRQANG